MNRDMDGPFQSIEGAQEYLKLLIDAVVESRNEVRDNLSPDPKGNAGTEAARSNDALRLVLYKLENLEKHVKASCRILNDLRTLRRLLLKERNQRAAEEWEKQERPAYPPY
jgi:hypothetical protein